MRDGIQCSHVINEDIFVGLLCDVDHVYSVAVEQHTQKNNVRYESFSSMMIVNLIAALQLHIATLKLSSAICVSRTSGLNTAPQEMTQIINYASLHHQHGFRI
jgi:hypothetical protein